MPHPGGRAGARLLLLPLLLPLLRGGHAGNLTVAVVLPLANTSYPWSWARVGPAVELALARAKARPDLLPGWTVRTVLGSSENARGVCSDTAAPLTAVDLKWEHEPAVFLGPGCVYAAAPVARFTAHWRVPLLTAGAPALGFGNKDEYALTTRAGPSHAKLGDVVAALHRRLGWARHALVLYAYQPDHDRQCFFLAEGLFQSVQERLNITVEHLEFAESAREHYAELLQFVQRKGRGERAARAPGAAAPLLLAAGPDSRAASSGRPAPMSVSLSCSVARSSRPSAPLALPIPCPPVLPQLARARAGPLPPRPVVGPTRSRLSSRRFFLARVLSLPSGLLPAPTCPRGSHTPAPSLARPADATSPPSAPAGSRLSGGSAPSPLPPPAPALRHLSAATARAETEVPLIHHGVSDCPSFSTQGGPPPPDLGFSLRLPPPAPQLSTSAARRTPSET